MEFAITASLLILILLGCVDFGRFVYAYVSVSNTACEGANFGSLHGVAEFGNVGNWRTAVVNATLAENNDISISASDVTVDTSVLTNKIVSVQVVHQFQLLTAWPGLPATLTLTRKAVMPITI